ncbi:hypothetical protein [Pseudomonas veronii]|uniref:hypothetical protein n=1 Tax=Pseudomonas veronii TaxID=76761 RepID=UPI0021C06E5E|nr:hypothetical protein [Pseudomonas veronii]MCT9826015.1 hypothetical protein [Pseudomonas veronii]
MNIAQRIFAICAVAALIGWVVTGWGVLLFLALLLGLFGSFGVFGDSGAAGEVETTSRAVAPEIASIEPVARVLPEESMVPATTEGNVRPSVGRRLFLDDDSDDE